jgi:hypothetical protein
VSLSGLSILSEGPGGTGAPIPTAAPSARFVHSAEPLWEIDGGPLPGGGRRLSPC